MQDGQVVVRSTKDQIEEFIDSFLWKDIKRELGIWRKGFGIEKDSIVEDTINNDRSSASVLLQLGDINGRTKAIDYLLNLPSVFLQILDSKQTNGG